MASCSQRKNFTGRGVSSAMSPYQACPVQPASLCSSLLTEGSLLTQTPSGTYLTLRMNLYLKQTFHICDRVLSSFPASSCFPTQITSPLNIPSPICPLLYSTDVQESHLHSHNFPFHVHTHVTHQHLSCPARAVPTSVSIGNFNSCKMQCLTFLLPDPRRHIFLEGYAR